MKKLIIALLSLVLTSPLFAEIIILKSGRTIEAEIIERAEDYIKIDVYGVPMTYYREDIEKIIGEAVNEEQNKFSSRTSSIKSSRDIFADVSPAVVYFSKKEYGSERRENIGSGFIVDSKGLIITNHHVVGHQFDRERLVVVLKDESTFPIESVVYTDPKYDMTILKITADRLPVVNLGNSDTVETGEAVYCIGASLGLEYSFSDGVLSGVRHDQDLRWLQLTAPVSPGNSGGPLINSKGEVIGLVTWQYREGQNINFALAINHIKPVLEKYRKLAFGGIDESTKADYYRMQGEKALQGDYVPSEDQYREAITYFEKALELKPDSFDLYMLLAKAYGGIRDYQKSVELYQKAIEINPEHHVPYARIGAIYRWRDPDKSISYYEKSIQIEPNVANADDVWRYEDLADLYGDTGRYREAKGLYWQLKRFYLSIGNHMAVSFIDSDLRELFLIKKWGGVLLFLLISSLITVGFAIRCLIKRKKLYLNSNKKIWHIAKGIVGIVFMIVGIVVTYYGVLVSNLWIVAGLVIFVAGTIAVFVKKNE